MQLGTGGHHWWPYLGNLGNFSALVIPHVRPTVFQIFSSGPQRAVIVGLGTQGVRWRWAPARLILSDPPLEEAELRTKLRILLRRRLITDRVKRIQHIEEPFLVGYNSLALVG